jgi:hypothetical protein
MNFLIKFLLLILISLTYFSCENKGKESKKNQLELSSDSITETGNRLIKGESITNEVLNMQDLVRDSNTYHSHHFIDFDKDSVPELLVISMTSIRSQCSSILFDTLCFEMNLELFGDRQNSWVSLSRYSIPDFNSRTLKIDSLDNINIITYQRHTGYSKGFIKENYLYNNGRFFLTSVSKEVTTKLYSAYGTSQDSWNYSLNMNNQKGNLIWSKIRQVTDSLVFSDSTINFNVLNVEIELGRTYSFDSLIGEKNKVYYY